MRKYLSIAFIAIAAFALNMKVAVAAPLILANSIQFACENGNPVAIVDLNSVTNAFYGGGLRFHIDYVGNFSLPGSSWISTGHGGIAGVGSNPVTIPLPSSLIAGTTHTLLITTDPADPPTSGLSGSPYYSFQVASCKQGMTWQFNGVQQPTGAVEIGCGNCNAYVGDTSCTSALPLLCIRKSGAGFPLTKPVSIANYWSGGVIGTTADVVPPSTLAAANAMCAAQFGTNWRVAEFHDAGGWKFRAYGGVGDTTKRYWVHINDQPNGRCWN